MAGKSRVKDMDFKGAVESFEKAVEANPKSASAHFELACLYDQQESDPAAAIYHFERFLKLLPNSGKEEIVKTRILACKQQLAQTVSLGLVAEKQQREFDLLAEENKRLREDVEKWRAYAIHLQTLTNQAAAAVPAGGVAQPPGLGQARLSDSPGPVRLSVALPATSRTHIVKAGETPSFIARKYGVRVDALMTANPKLDARHMHVGQTLIIPRP